MSYRVPLGGIVDDNVAKSFLGQMIPMNLPGGEIVECLCVKVDVIQQEGMDPEGNRLMLDRGITITLEMPAEDNPLANLLLPPGSVGFNVTRS